MDNCTRRHPSDSRRLARGGALVILLIVGCSSATVEIGRAESTGAAGTNQADSVLALPGPMDHKVPEPESILGHAIGDAAVRYDVLVRYLNALADSSPLVALTPYARSHEDRELYYLTITSETNHARLAAIQADNATLADPRTLSGADQARRIVDTLPGIAWLSYSIHGDELSSTDAAVQVAFHLAAGMDDATKALREQLVIHIDPLMNPDGRERFLSHLQQLTGKVANSDYQAMQHSGLWSAGRGNHYLFDLNRDWLMQVHPETRGRAAVIRSWNPHLLVDSHEMGSLDTYLFDPPREPLNVHMSEHNMKWRRRFSADHAEAFNRHGWSYYTKEWHEEWYPGYTNAWAGLLGAVGLLYEQAGVHAASVKQATGHEVTYRDAVRHQVVSTMANLQTLADNRREVIADFLADRQWAVSDAGPFSETFLLPPPADRTRFNRLVDLLHRQGIETTTAGASFEVRNVVDVWRERAAARDFPAGTLVVRSSQPHRRLLHAMCAFDPHMSEQSLVEERKELESRRGTRIYDVTAWNLPMAYGLEAFWAEGVPEVAPSSRQPLPHDGTIPAAGDVPKYGYIIDGGNHDVYRALVRLLDRDCKPRVATKPFTIAGRKFAAGAVLLRRHENPDALPSMLQADAGDLTLAVHPLDTALSDKGPDLGGKRFRLLQAPRVAIASQWPVSSTSFGATWHLLDERLGLRASPINVQRLSRIDLRRYNVLVLPNTWQAEFLRAVIGEPVVRKIKAWVEAGGTLIAMGGSAAFVAGKGRGLSAVRLRRDALGELAIYEEAVQRERQARSIKIDAASVWGTTPPTTSPSELPAVAPNEKHGPGSNPASDLPALERADEWLRVFRPRGAIGAATLDPAHWLTFGLGEKLPVLLGGSYAYLSRHPVATPARLMDEHHIRLSGLMWPEARSRLAGSAYATVERVGSGQVILFATDPFFRGYFEGSGRLLLNAMILGPGLGASTPIPW